MNNSFLNMKRFVTFLLAAALCAVSLQAQTKTQEEYHDRYQMLISRLGVDGVGVETLLNRWGEDYPEDVDMLLGKFAYYLSKSRSNDVKVLDQDKYLGEPPTLTLKDSLGNDVKYFSVTEYDDEIFGKSAQAVDRAIELNPSRLDLRLFKISALIGYEKESPDMALSNLKALIDYNGQNHPEWTYPGLEMDDEAFAATIQEYCYAFFRMGIPAGYEAFRELSEKMLSYYPSNPLYMTNIGSYHFVYKHDNKTALKIYNKVLKKHPDDYATIKNCVLLARSAKDTKLEKKYLPMLVKVAADDTERASAEARLKAL